MVTINAKTQHLTIPGHDGTPLAVCVMGDGPIDWLLAPGLGTPLITWKHVAERFGRGFRIITWEARGQYGSGVPADLDKLRVEDHTADLFALADRFRAKRFVLGGWSMGVQISLEAYHQQSDRISALLLLNGAPGKLLSTAYGALPGFAHLARAALRYGSKHGRALTPVVEWALSQGWTLPLMKKMQIFTNNDEFFRHMVAPFATLDFGVYFHMMLLTDQHTAIPYLREVGVPTLVTAGTKDLMTPLETARLMAETIDGAELFIIPDGTHYTLAEYPEIVNLRLERFFRDHLPKAKLD